MINGLTQKRANFALNLFEGMSQREAYIEAGYSSNQSLATIDRHACDLAKSDKIMARIGELQQKAEDAAISTKQERLKILTQIQRATVSDFVDQYGNLDIKDKTQLTTAAVAEIKTERTPVGIKTTLKLRDPVGAISEHNKMERIYEVKEPGEVNIFNQTLNVGVRIDAKNLSDAELLAIISRNGGKGNGSSGQGSQ